MFFNNLTYYRLNEESAAYTREQLAETLGGYHE